MKSLASLIGHGSVTPSYSDLRVGEFVRLIRGWGLAAFRATISGGVRPINLITTEADLVLSFFDGAKPGHLVTKQTDALADQMGVLTESFARLSDLDRLVLDAGATPWKGFGPVGVATLENALVEAAFGDGEFRRQVFGAIHAKIKSRVLLPPDQRIVRLTMSPVMFWCLIALSLRSAGTARGGGRKSWARDMVRDSALRLGCRPGWAGFWEQWLFREFLSVNRPDTTCTLENALRTLPLVAEGAQALNQWSGTNSPSKRDDGEGATAEPPSAFGLNAPTERWREAAPEFAVRLLAGSV